MLQKTLVNQVLVVFLKTTRQNTTPEPILQLVHGTIQTSTKSHGNIIPEKTTKILGHGEQDFQQFIESKVMNALIVS